MTKEEMLNAYYTDYDKNYKGFSLSRYNNIFNEDTFTNNTVKEIENLKKIIK